MILSSNAEPAILIHHRLKASFTLITMADHPVAWIDRHCSKKWSTFTVCPYCREHWGTCATRIVMMSGKEKKTGVEKLY